MLNNYHYFIVNREPENGKYFAEVLRVRDNVDLLGIFAGYKDLKTVNACTTKKAAEELRDFWNECFKNNGTYAF